VTSAAKTITESLNLYWGRGPVSECSRWEWLGMLSRRTRIRQQA
jgi:hypothetical protein